jgi:hypothetical protein
MSRKKAETILQEAILAELTTRYSMDDCWMWDNRAVGTFVTLSGGCVRFGQRGQADLIGMVRGVALAMEIKTTVGSLSADQRRWRALWERAGGVWSCPRSVGSAVEIVEIVLKTQEITGLQKKLKIFSKTIATLL